MNLFFAALAAIPPLFLRFFYLRHTTDNASSWRSGPQLQRPQRGFALNWLETTGEILTVERFFREPRRETDGC